MDNNRNNNSNNNNDNRKKNNRNSLIILAIASLLVFMMFYYLQTMIRETSYQEKTYEEFVKLLEEKQIDNIVVASDRVEFQYKKDIEEANASSSPEATTTPQATGEPAATTVMKPAKTTYYAIRIYDEKLIDRLDAAGVSYKGELQDTGSGIMSFLLSYIIPFAGIWIVFYFVMRMVSKGGGGMMGVGKSNAKIYVEKETGVTFKDVAGQEEAKESLTELVDFLHNPAKYTKIGAKLPKGALLVGPPGTGKTLLAKAVAGEAKVPFFSLSGSDFVEMFVGVGASRVRDLFKEAQAKAPCIIFIDEVDAIGKSRDNHYGGGNDEREQTLNQLLSEMDGFDTSKGLVILAATNRPEVLDKALLRPGRFDRRVIVDKPDLKGRKDILRVHAKNVLMDETVDLDAIALATSGAVGSDLANMINEAAIMAVKDGRTAVSQADLFESVEVVIAGKEKKDRILGKEEKRIVAYHEVGHALVTALLKDSEPVQKITIVPRTMGSLGYVMQVPEEEKYLMSKDEMITRITTLFGGRAAEQLIFNSITTGASNDIEKATELARAMVTQYGMTEEFGLICLESVENKYLDGRTVMNCADSTASLVDQEVMKILKECYEKAKELLSGNKETLDKIAEFLIEKETITGKEFMDIYHKVIGKEASSEEMILEINEISSDEISLNEISLNEISSNEISSNDTSSTEEKVEPETTEDVGSHTEQ